MRFNVTMEDDFVDRLDRFAEVRGLSRSALIRTACLQYMDAAEALPDMKLIFSGVLAAAGKAITGSITKDQLQETLDGADVRLKALTQKK